MKDELLAPMHTWLIEPLESKVAESIERLRRAPSVQRLAIMPDVHLANEVCIGVVMATSLPQECPSTMIFFLAKRRARY